ncbi:glycosyltransferase [Microbacterium sp. CGR1]|uniref:glycosyltransferase n=1 Tax=Microbacterium sp. CGR1 TaxID=1696072 RepID=UPI003DA3C0B3
MMQREPSEALRTRPTATVVIPCYNYGHFLPASVASALDQEGVDVDVVIVDDASPDGSVEVARALAAADPRISLIAHETNKGHILTYNDGLATATGDYVVLLSADDLLTKDALSRALALMERHPEVGLVYGPVVIFDEVPPAEKSAPSEEWVVWGGREWADRLFRYGVNVIKSPEAVVRTSVLRQVGLYDPEHPHAGDLQMWLRIAAVSDVGYLPGVVQACYRQHTQNMHSAVFGTDQVRGMVTDLQHRLDAFTTAASSFGEAERLATQIRLTSAREAIDLASRAYVWGFTETWPVDEFVEFARQQDPAVDETTAGRAFRRRRTVGPRLSRRNPLFVLRERRLTGARRAAEEHVVALGLPG